MLRRSQILIIRRALTVGIALVWLINGLFCKLMNLVPRHQMIVARILGVEHAAFYTKLIGCAEVLMALWILSRIKPMWCAITQIFVVALMNSIEFVLTPGLLLFHHSNLGVAAFFILIILVNEFILNKSTVTEVKVY